MKKNYTLVLAILATVFSFAQTIETFDGVLFPVSYSNGSVTPPGTGVTWTYTASRNANADANGAGIGLPAIMLRRSSDNSKIVSSSIQGGVKKVTMKLYKGFTSPGNRQVELFINGTSKGTSIAFDDADDKDDYTFEVDNINITGNFTIEVRNTRSTQVIVDNIVWTPYTMGVKTYKLEK